MSAITRSTLQSVAARANGSVSCGPVTALGKVIASANSIRHAFAASCALLPGETEEDYRERVSNWFASLRPANQAEARIVARLADLDFRLERVTRAEEKLLARTIEAQLETTETYSALVKARNALQGIRGLAALAETTPANVSSDRVAQILPAMNRVGEIVDAVDLPATVTVPLQHALEAFVLDSIVEAAPGTFEDVARAARGIEEALVARLTETELAVEQERERIANVVLFPAGEDARVLDRHRSRLAREIERAAKALKIVRELSATVPHAASGSSVEFVLEVRAIGRVGAR